MKTALSLLGVLAAGVLFSGCVDDPVYRHHRHVGYYGGPYRRANVVVYDNGPGYYGYRDRGYYNGGYYGGGYYDGGVNRTYVRNRTYRTNVYENRRQVVVHRGGTIHRENVVVVKKGKKKHKDSDDH
jgi:hypothetical protein